MSKSKKRHAAEEEEQTVTDVASSIGGGGGHDLDFTDSDETFFQDIDLLQNHGIVSRSRK